MVYHIDDKANNVEEILICVYMYTFMYMYRISSTFHELTNDIIKLCEMAGDRSKIKTNHTWMGPKRGGDMRAYTALGQKDPN